MVELQEPVKVLLQQHTDRHIHELCSSGSEGHGDCPHHRLQFA